MIFRNIYNKQFTLKQAAREIKDYIKADQDKVYNFVIGTDSVSHHNKTIFVTAMIIHRIGKGARFFYTRRRTNYAMDIYSRLLQETYDSIKVMKEIEKTEILYSINNFSIHIDVGNNGKSRQVLHDCINYVKGFGYDCKVKPEAFVASNVADRFTK
ncbi:ribonuclease H-like YkuK family protein [Spirochaetota bacterium]